MLIKCSNPSCDNNFKINKWEYENKYLFGIVACPSCRKSEPFKQFRYDKYIEHRGYPPNFKSKEDYLSRLKKCPTCQSEFLGKSKETKFCSNSCAQSSPETNENKKKTYRKNYGADHNMKSKKGQEEYQNGMVNKHGVTHPLKSESIRKQTRETNVELHGVEYPLQNKEILAKVEATNEERYGASNVLASEYGKKKTKESNLERFDVENPQQNKEIHEKTKATNFKKNGVEYFFQNMEVRKKAEFTKKENIELNLKKRIGDHNLTKLNTKDWLEEEFRKKTCGEIAEDIGVSTMSIHRRMVNHDLLCYRKNFSSGEITLYDFLVDELDIDSVIRNTKKIISPLELDIYLPDHNLAIEFNGIYWHSEQNGKDRNYHLNKTRFCEEKGIQLLHIFENEWNEKQDIWKSIIRNKLNGNLDKIFARKCEVRKIDSKTANLFLDDNHLQGRDRSSIRIGLFYEDELVSLFTIGKSRYNKKYQYEIHRFCNKLNTSIIGGFGKLCKYFERNYKPDSLITYADKRFSDGNLYNNFFDHIHDSKPNYFYVVNGSLHSRIAYQKHKLADKLDLFDESLSEYQNMLLNGYDRIWDCGNMAFIKQF